MKSHSYMLCIAAGIACVTGCVTLKPREDSARSAADKLELIQLGTTYDEVARKFLPSNSVPVVARLRYVEFLVHGLLVVNPCRRDIENIRLYRQYPKGILLELAEDDVELELNVADAKYQEGGVYVFFNPKGQYKGYFAFSTARYSKDEPTRFSEEQMAFKELGFEEEFLRAQHSMELFKAGGEARKQMPKLPLSKNRASSIR